MKPDKTTVDTILFNGNIQTVDDSLTVVQAIAIHDGNIVAVGSNEEMLATYTATKLIDLEGKNVLPGLIDPHCHFYGYGMSMRNADLRGTSNWDEVLAIVVEHEKANSTGWILGRGWDQNDWEAKDYPTKKELDALFPDQPVALTRIDGHAVIANTA
ncbi:MAG: putative amidohydrolase YtcJ, partial [Bacteroidia bacterium]